jgi:hypothetical protein
MTSVTRSTKQLQPNALYINITSVASTIVDSNNVLVPWAQGNVSAANNSVLGLLSTPGSLVLRDMGTILLRPNPTVPTAVGSQSTIYRRVQVVTTGGVGGYFGTGDSASSVAGSQSDYYCGFISLGAQTYGGGNGIPTGVARLN